MQDKNVNPWIVNGSSKVRLVSVTPDAEETMVYVARVSNPKNQNNPSIRGLIKYCAEHGHWSVFEQASMTVEIVTPLAISIQVLRHRSFTYQQFSGRYSDQQELKEINAELPAYEDLVYLPTHARLQDTTNRQNSILANDFVLDLRMREEMATSYKAAIMAYNNLLDMGIAKEIARFVLPEGVYTRLYMTGNLRSFITFCRTRDDEGVVQYEHVELARCIRKILSREFPIAYESFFE